MYRPTVRYDDIFREYVDSLFRATDLDRNQIIRAALFAAAHSKEFQNLLQPHQKKDVPLPFPLWELDQNCYWLEQRPQLKQLAEVTIDINDKKDEIRDFAAPVNCKMIRKKAKKGTELAPKLSEALSSQQSIKIKNQGGIIFTLN
jgi:hypothetical protein